MADDDEVVEEEQAPELVIESGEQIITTTDVDRPLAPPKYEVRPGLGEKFQAANVRDIIIGIMQDQLVGRPYRIDLAPRWAKAISNAVRQKVEDLEMKRYKIIVTCTILETRGAGVKCGQRCMWDPETDDYIGDLYKSDTLFCYTAVYGVYMY